MADAPMPQQVALPAQVLSLEELKERKERLIRDATMGIGNLQQMIVDSIGWLPDEQLCQSIARHVALDVPRAKAVLKKLRLIEKGICTMLINASDTGSLTPLEALDVNPLRLVTLDCLKSSRWPDPLGCGPSVAIAWGLMRLNAQPGRTLGQVANFSPDWLWHANQSFLPLSLRTMLISNWRIVHLHPVPTIPDALVSFPCFIALPDTLAMRLVETGRLLVSDFPCQQANSFLSVAHSLSKLLMWIDQIPSIKALRDENLMIIGVNHAVGRLPVVLKNADGTGGLKHWHNQSYCGFATILEPPQDETEIVLTPEEIGTLVLLDTQTTLRELTDGLHWDMVHSGQHSIHRHIALPSKLSFLLGAGRTAGPGASLQSTLASQRNALSRNSIGSSEVTIVDGSGSRLRITTTINKID
ncbi:unnamed protein product [Symbiodinium natans]|uniref:Uncharacterized protein n=1 Tax=Symbiodinium natans TaxID=878477 RepID=A0A812UD17_9DINO|nr:unnamed protein product [Symbiodinium natans]